MKLFLATLFALAFPMMGLAKGTPEEEARYAMWEADFAELESCIQDVIKTTAVSTCVGFITESCKVRTPDKSRAGSMGCHGYERDLWHLAYTRALGRAAGNLAKRGPRGYLMLKIRRDIAEVFFENEVLWQRAIKAECDFYLYRNESMAGGFRNLRCQMKKYETRIRYLNDLGSY